MTLSYFQNYFVHIYVLTCFFSPKCFDFCHSRVLVRDNGHSNIKRYVTEAEYPVNQRMETRVEGNI